MNLTDNWPAIRQVVNLAFRTNFHVSIASVNTAGEPTITPVGTLFLKRSAPAAFYFEKFITALPKNKLHQKKVCILAVNSGRWFWLKSLFRGKFSTYPGVKLYGTLGEKRAAQPEEIDRLKKRMRATKGTKGNSYLWGDMDMVRDIEFYAVTPIRLGELTPCEAK